jgi:dTDP-4-dehydrorhamnose 3,5-epimerase
MRFIPLELTGAYLIEPELREDERGFFARVNCREEFAAHGLCTHWVQCNVSYNRRAGTLRGLHFQDPPAAEIKLVRCTRGAVYDAIVDLRPGSPHCRRWQAVELTADNHRMLYIPEGFAHGYQTLVEDSEVFYQVSAFYSPGLSRGVRWDDPALGIPWPACRQRVISPRDQDLPLLPS